VSEHRALEALEASGIAYRIVRHTRVNSLAEAAARGVEPAAIVKTIVVRRGDDDFLFVLVAGDRTISCPSVQRVYLGVSAQVTGPCGRPGPARAGQPSSALDQLRDL
jgi:Cys-tRNA(Pro)/Cys-tRNA(Cys) deacylase